MDIIDIYKSLGLTDQEITNLTDQIFDTKLKLANNLSDEHQYLLNKEMHRQQVQKYLENFDNLTITNEEIMYQTAEIIYAKTIFLASIGIEINNENKRYLLLSEDGFYHTFGVTYAELLKLYPYNEYEENLKLK